MELPAWVMATLSFLGILIFAFTLAILSASAEPDTITVIQSDGRVTELPILDGDYVIIGGEDNE